jgi:hypothetical protein
MWLVKGAPDLMQPLLGLPSTPDFGSSRSHKVQTVGIGVENSGHFAGFIPNEPFHATVFPAEQPGVFAGEEFDGLPRLPKYQRVCRPVA